MAFGLGFNKAKVMSAAEKLASQGKIPAAIEEYRKIMQHDPKDLMVLNTLADLYIRIGKNDEAIKLFSDLAEKCVEAGMVPRAIAVHKRILKIAPNSVQPLLKLGELYSMQGLLRDARTNYQQAAEFYSQRKDKEKALEVFEKILMLDLENPQLQVRMAELYAEAGKKAEAISTYLGAVERFLDKNQPAEADSALQVLLRLDPQNPDVLGLLGRAQLERGEFGKAVETLLAVPSLTAQKDGLNLLFHAYTKLGDAANAKKIATRLFDEHEDLAGLAQISEELISRGELKEALEIYDSASQRLVAQGASSLLIDGLKKILASQASHTGALLLMLKIYQASGNPGEVRETTELLAHAYAAQGELAKARDLYAELVTIEPDNPEHLRLLHHLEEQMGVRVASPDASPEPTAMMAAELSPAAEEESAKVETLSPLEEQLVKNCLTESDLYKTYHQTSKAIETLEKGLAQLPGNITLNEHLLSLYEESQEYRKAAGCCEALAQAYVQLGDGERASRYGELLLSHQQKAEERASQPAAAFPVEVATTEETAAEEAFPSGGTPTEDQPQVREVDLSMEWASVGTTEGLSGREGSPSGAPQDSAVEEIEFYVQAGLISEATEALEGLRKRFPSHPAIRQFEEKLGLAPAAAPPTTELSAAEPTPAVEVTEAPAEESVATAAIGEFETAALGLEGESPQPVFPTESETSPAPSAAPEAEQELVLEEALPSLASGSPAPAFELSLEETGAQPQETATQTPIVARDNLPETPAFTGTQEQVLEAAAQPQDRFAALAGDLEGALNLPEEPIREQTPSPPQPLVAPKTPADSAPVPASQPQGGSLQDIFAEFKAEMEEPAAAEDLETHYNMGVAFREMALYDEAIGEFQKVHQLAAKTKDYSHVVQSCSLLAACFLEKGLPQLAVKWYQTAIDSPGVEPESALALLYEMALAYEIAGDHQAALRSFLEVYARNIDYRDVAERIRSIKQAQ